jgi:hypothetical protein
MSDSRMIHFALPTDREVLSAIGIVAIRHAQLEYVLRMMIKSLGGVTIRQALDATSRVSVAVIRDRIKKLAKKRFGDGNVLLQLEAMMKNCGSATAKRNSLLHGFAARELDGSGGVITQDDNHEWRPFPSSQELSSLAIELATLVEELNEARLHGYLKEAMDRYPAV